MHPAKNVSLFIHLISSVTWICKVAEFSLPVATRA